MRLARQRDGRFLVSREEGLWESLDSLAVDARDTREVIENWDAIQQAVASSSQSGLISDPDLVSPVHRPGKILCIGLNYLDHIRETGAEQPERPIVFAKYTSALTGPFDPVVVDARLTEQADYEAELAVVIGRSGRWLTEQNAIDAVFGYTVANDVSARDWQRRDGQFSRSKSMDSFCPIGPWIVTADELPDAQNKAISSRVNGEVRQDSNTDQMLFGIVDLLVFLSQTMTLEPGDVILTGTPPGVGFAMDPPRHLTPGDEVACRIEGIGEIVNPIVGADEAP